VQFHSNEDSLQKILLKKADWIIIDAPCTGVGTLRRNPDIKLRFTE
jgi:16S rRNA (cytosine967-C5)-methyltransferase